MIAPERLRKLIAMSKHRMSVADWNEALRLLNELNNDLQVVISAKDDALDHLLNAISAKAAPDLMERAVLEAEEARKLV